MGDQDEGDRSVCCFDSLDDLIAVTPCILCIQIFYTIVLWIFLISYDDLNSWLELLFFLPTCCCAMPCICKLADGGDRLQVKCLPLASLVMVIFSAFPLFIIFFNCLTLVRLTVGDMVLLALSGSFTMLWLTIYFEALHKVQTEFGGASYGHQETLIH